MNGNTQSSGARRVIITVGAAAVAACFILAILIGGNNSSSANTDKQTPQVQQLCNQLAGTPSPAPSASKATASPAGTSKPDSKPSASPSNKLIVADKAHLKYLAYTPGIETNSLGPGKNYAAGQEAQATQDYYGIFTTDPLQAAQLTLAVKHGGMDFDPADANKLAAQYVDNPQLWQSDLVSSCSQITDVRLGNYTTAHYKTVYVHLGNNPSVMPTLLMYTKEGNLGQTLDFTLKGGHKVSWRTACTQLSQPGETQPPAQPTTPPPGNNCNAQHPCSTPTTPSTPGCPNGTCATTPSNCNQNHSCTTTPPVTHSPSPTPSKTPPKSPPVIVNLTNLNEVQVGQTSKNFCVTFILSKGDTGTVYFASEIGGGLTPASVKVTGNGSSQQLCPTYTAPNDSTITKPDTVYDTITVTLSAPGGNPQKSTKPFPIQPKPSDGTRG